MNQYAPFDSKQVDYLRKCKSSWFNVAEGGKRGAKNVINSLAFCIALENHPNKLHLVAGVSIATARLNIIDCDGYGIMNYFYGRCKTGKYQNKDCLYVKTFSGEKVILIAGGAKEGDEKYIKGNTYGMAYITEANECCQTFIKEVFDRTLSSDDRKIFHDLNPKAPNHWYYTEILRPHELNQEKYSDYGYNYGHFNIFNNLSISNEKLKERLRTYQKGSIWYKRDIIGQRIASSGVLFGDIANNKVRYLTTQKIPGYVTTGVDFGKAGSKHAFCTQIISRNFQQVIVVRSDEVSCKIDTEDVDQSMSNDGIGFKLKGLKDGFLKHIKLMIKTCGHIDCVYADSAEPALIDFLQNILKESGLNISVKPSLKIPINDRIYLFGLLLMQDRIKFIQGETEEIITGLQEAMQDEEADDDRWLDDGTSDIDILDSLDYGIESWYNQLIRLGGIR